MGANSGPDGSHPDCNIKGIPVGLKCRRLHFLHTANTGVPDGTALGRYVMHFADGQTQEFPLIREQNIHSAWWPEWRPRTLGDNCRIAWTGANRIVQMRDHSQWLYRTTWENPSQDIEITHIDVIAVPPDSWIGLFGITAEE